MSNSTQRVSLFALWKLLIWVQKRNVGFRDRHGGNLSDFAAFMPKVRIDMVGSTRKVTRLLSVGEMFAVGVGLEETIR